MEYKMYVLIFSEILSETFLILGRIQLGIMNVYEKVLEGVSGMVRLFRIL